jgi:hypothetical protein
LEELHDLALEVARQTLAADSEFPQLMGLAKQLIVATLGRESTRLSKTPELEVIDGSERDYETVRRSSAEHFLRIRKA